MLSKRRTSSSRVHSRFKCCFATMVVQGLQLPAARLSTLMAYTGMLAKETSSGGSPLWTCKDRGLAQLTMPANVNLNQCLNLRRS